MIIIFPVSTTASSIEENILRCHKIPIITQSLISKLYSVVVFFTSLLCRPLRFQNSPQTRCLETSPPSRLPPQDRSLSLTLLSLFLSFVFCPTSFQRECVAFRVPGVLCQCSEVVLRKLLSIQMIFWWICGGESGLPVLFLHHLRTTQTLKKKVTVEINHRYMILQTLWKTTFHLL